MDDLISRQAAIKYLMTNMNWYDEDGYESDDDYKRECITELINGVPSAQPEPKRGRWIYHIDDLFPAESTMECNQCHAEQPLTCDDEFCSHCGADMRGENDG